jgi:hypothetical protein
MKKLKDYIIELQALVEEFGDLPLYTADDAEGNGYTAVYYSPGVVYAESAAHRLDSVYSEDELEDAEIPLVPILLLN